MMRINQLKFWTLLLSVIAFSYNCKKSITTQENNETFGEIQVINNSRLANISDTLQAIYTDKDSTVKGYYYGSFDSEGKPDSVKRLVINKIDGDSSVNIFFDDKMRVRYLYLTKNGIKQNALLTFEYDSTGNTTVSNFYYNPITDSAKLLSQYTVNNVLNNGLYTILNHKSYAFLGSGIFNLLQINTGTSSLSNNFITSFGSANAAIAILNAVIFSGTTGIGCLLGSTIPGVGTAIGCAVGGIAGLFMTTNPANANELIITNAPSNAPNSSSAAMQLSLLLTNPSSYPILKPSGTGCYGTIMCGFICSSNYWDATTNSPLLKDATGVFKKINGVLFTGVGSNWGAPVSFINANNGSATTLEFINIRRSNGIVTGNVYILGDFGGCDPSQNSNMYITSFNLALINTTLGSVAMYENVDGNYQKGSNTIFGHQ